MPNDEMPMIGARIPSDLNDDLEAYCDDLGIRKSEGVRRLLQTGIEQTRPQSVAISFGAFFSLIGLGMIIASYIDPASTATRTGAVLLALGVLIELAPSLKSTIAERTSQFYQRNQDSE